VLFIVQVLTVGSVVGNEVVFFAKNLRCIQGLLRSELEPGAAVCLQLNQIERQRRVSGHPFFYDSCAIQLFRDVSEKAFHDSSVKDLPFLQKVTVLIWNETNRKRCIAGGTLVTQGVVHTHNMVFDLHVAVNNKPKRWGLNASYTKRARRVIEQRIVAGEVDPEHEVRDASSVGAYPKRHVLLVRFKMIHLLADVVR